MVLSVSLRVAIQISQIFRKKGHLHRRISTNSQTPKVKHQKQDTGCSWDVRQMLGCLYSSRATMCPSKVPISALEFCKRAFSYHRDRKYGSYFCHTLSMLRDCLSVKCHFSPSCLYPSVLRRAVWYTESVPVTTWTVGLPGQYMLPKPLWKLCI